MWPAGQHEATPYTGRPPYEIRPVYGDPFHSAFFCLLYEKDPHILASRHMRSGRYMGILFLRRFLFCYMKRIPMYQSDRMWRPNTGRSAAFLSRFSKGVHSRVVERHAVGHWPATTNDAYLCGSECSAAGRPGWLQQIVFLFIIWKSFAAVRFWNSIGDDEI